ATVYREHPLTVFSYRSRHLRPDTSSGNGEEARRGSLATGWFQLLAPSSGAIVSRRGASYHPRGARHRKGNRTPGGEENENMLNVGPGHAGFVRAVLLAGSASVALCVPAGAIAQDEEVVSDRATSADVADGETGSGNAI